MKTVEVSIESREAPWNANRMNEEMLARLKESIWRYGLVTNLVVRKLAVVAMKCYPVTSAHYKAIS